MKKIFLSESQGPEDKQNRCQPRAKPSFMIALIAWPAVGHTGKRVLQKRKGRLRGIQVMGPVAKRGGIRYTIKIFEGRRRLFPGTVLSKAPPQCLYACQQAVLRVRKREQREEGEGFAATKAVTPTDPNPVVMFMVSLLMAASMPDDGIAFTNGTLPQDHLIAAFIPIGF